MFHNTWSEKLTREKSYMVCFLRVRKTSLSIILRKFILLKDFERRDSSKENCNKTMVYMMFRDSLVLNDVRVIFFIYYCISCSTKRVLVSYI